MFGLSHIFIREMKNWLHISWNLLVSAEMYIIVKAIKGIRGERMKKNLLMIIMAMVMCFSFAACGGGGNDEKDDGIDPNATMTKEQYQQLREDNWSEMTPEEMEQYLGVKYVENKESTEDLLRKFEYVAKYDDRSMNWYLLHLIKNEIADFEEKHGEIPTASDSKTE